VTVLAGILTPIENVLTEILTWLHSSLGLTWAWAIVLLTTMVRMAILPLTVQQIRSMQRLAIFAPQLKALQEKYKGDKQRLNEEVMKFYREHKVNPAASCLPILPQIPIFISLFYVLKGFNEEIFPSYPESDLSFLNGLVEDITAPFSCGLFARIAQAISPPSCTEMSWCTTIFGKTSAQTVAMWLSTTTLQSKTQRILMLVLPVVFIPVVINFPVGLLVYWMTTNFWTIGQGIVTRRVFPRPPLELPKRTSRAPGRAEPAPVAVQQNVAGAKPKTAGKAAAKTEPATGGGSSPGPRPVRRRKKRGPQTRRR
jgi:YidC/Oxa1 family membrane protein insertase